ncbi:MAG: histidine triad nucleotide-binding protein [Thermacetogeniaceae bacterium]
MSDCVFCKIVSRQLSSSIVYEDEEFLAFRDINPVAPTHVLLIPKKHMSSLLDVPEQDAPLLGRLMSLAAKLAKDLGLADEGFRVVINTGKNGGQTVGHLHLHLLGGRALQWPPG